MGILPKELKLVTDVELDEGKDGSRKQGNTFLVDFQKKEMLRKDGKLIKTDDERSVRMWIDKVLLTEKNKYKIYDLPGFEPYGMEYKEKLLGQRFPTPVLYSEFIRELEETMARNKQILEIRNIQVNLINGTLYTKFTVVLKDFKQFEWEAYLNDHTKNE